MVKHERYIRSGGMLYQFLNSRKRHAMHCHTGYLDRHIPQSFSFLRGKLEQVRSLPDFFLEGLPPLEGPGLRLRDLQPLTIKGIYEPIVQFCILLVESLLALVAGKGETEERVEKEGGTHYRIRCGSRYGSICRGCCRGTCAGRSSRRRRRRACRVG